MLRLHQISSGYGPVCAIDGIDLTVGKGEVVAVVGANGVGKTTLLKTIAGLLKPQSGTIELDGHDVTRLESHRRILEGVVLVPEGRRLFSDLSVGENLKLGAFSQRRRLTRADIRSSIDECCDLFPILAQRRAQLAGTLSGGEQQMVAIARGLMSRPSLLLLDEPSLGLAPLMIRQIFAIIGRLTRDRGISVVLVEQDAQAALALADRGYVMQRARIVMTGTGKALRADPRTREIYFGK